MSSLDIKVYQARNLPKSDVMFNDMYLVGMADPYAVVGMRNKRRERTSPYVPEHKTETLTSTLNPEWNAQFRLQFSGTQDEISVQIWDWDKYKYDDYIGEALIPTAPLVHAFKQGQAQILEITLYSDCVDIVIVLGSDLMRPTSIKRDLLVSKETYNVLGL